MIDPNAEDCFRQGLERLVGGAPRDALAYLRQAVELADAADRDDPATARYHSYYGLCLYRSRLGYRDALASCRRGVSLDEADPDLWLNLGRVALGVRRRAEAWRALTTGLRIEPGHPGIGMELRRMGERRKPILAFLERGHPLNVALGRIRARGGTPNGRVSVTEAPVRTGAR